MIAAKATAPIPNATILDDDDQAATAQLYWMMLTICNGAALNTVFLAGDSQKLVIRTIKENLASNVKNYQGVIEQIHFIDQRQAVLQNERAIRRVKERTSAVLLQSRLDDKWLSDSMKCCCYLRNDQDLLADVKSQNELRFGASFSDMLCSRGEFGKKIF